MKDLLKVSILLLFFFSYHSHSKDSCNDVDSVAFPVSYFYLGCYGASESENPSIIIQDLSENFSNLSRSESLLLRTIAIVNGQNFPSRNELSSYFDELGDEIQIGDALVLTMLRRLSGLWSTKIFSFYNTKEYEEITSLVLQAGIVETISWYGTAESQLPKSQSKNSLDLQDFIGRIEASTIPWASAIMSSIYYDGRLAPLDHAEAFRLASQDIDKVVTSGSRLIDLLEYDAISWLDKVPSDAIDEIGRFAKAGLLRSINVFGSLTQFPIFSGDSYKYPSYSALLERSGRYGDPVAQFELGKLLLDGERGFQKNTSRAYNLFDQAANWGFPLAIDQMIKKNIVDRDYEAAFIGSLINSSEGWVTFSDYGFQIAYVLAELAFDEEVAEIWQDFLAVSCKEALLKHSDSSNCPKPRTNRKYNAKFGLELAESSIEDIQLVGRYRLQSGQYKALLIGNAAYENWSSLETPIKDVDALREVLESDYGFEVVTLKNASRRNILKAIYDLGASSNFSDHLLVYYAGHGVVDRMSDVAYWIPADAGRDFAPDWVSANEILNALKSVEAKHLLLLADSCYSGKLLRGDAPTINTPTESVVKRLFQKKARVAITSGGEEPVSDSSMDSNHSVFASALLHQLDTNNSPLPASTLYEGILDKVTREASQTPQYADMRELDHDGGDFIFIPTNWSK